MLIPMLLWPLLVYEIETTTVETMEAKINKFTRKWLGVPPGLSDVALYCRQAKLRLPLKSITEEYKVGKTRLQLMLQDSSDDVVRMIQPTLKKGCLRYSFFLIGHANHERFYAILGGSR